VARADAWAQSGARPLRASVPVEPRRGRPMSADRPSASRNDAAYPRTDDRYRDAPPRAPRNAAPAARNSTGTAPAENNRGGRVRGVVAVAAMFLVTLAGAGIDSFVGIGLGLVTLVAMFLITAVAALVVRRRDLASVVVAPPLVFLAVAGMNIALAPSASFNLPTVATLLVRGFPTMAVATGVALVLALFRLVSRR
jgi:hypothetical protein